jgi:hypothetical protein
VYSEGGIGCRCEKDDLGVQAFHDVYDICYVSPDHCPFSLDVDSRLGKELELAARGFFQVERRSFPWSSPGSRESHSRPRL